MPPQPPEPPTERTDLYECLGVAANASAEEIKRAYRAATLKYHPDKNRGDLDAEAKCKAVNEAYKILSDPQQRKLYDFYTTIRQQQQQQPDPMDIFGHFFNNMAPSAGGGGVFVGMNPHMFMGSGGGSQRYPPQQQDISAHDLEECFAELIGMLHPQSQQQPSIGRPLTRTMSTSISSSAAAAAVAATAEKEPPEPIAMQLEITMQDVYNGAQLPIQIERTITMRNRVVTERETVYIVVYQGIDDGEVIMVSGKGNIVDGEKGDVKVTIRVSSATTEFKRKGLDLIFVKHITLKDALCGEFEFEIKLLDGESCTIKNKPGCIIEPNLRKTYAGMGLTRGGTKGNMIVHFIVDFPTALTEAQLAQIKGFFPGT